MHSVHASRGIALITVLSILTVSALLVLASARSALLHEMIAGQQSDQARAQAAADALLRDAELDILGQDAEGRPCRPPAPGTVGCRARGAGAAALAPYFPQTPEEFEEVRDWLRARNVLCSEGICIAPTLTALDGLASNLDAVQASGATYGQFTRTGLSAPGTAGNPLLASEGAPRAWYWAEVLRYDTGPDAMATAAPRGHLQPDPARPFVYRITAMALGLKPGTRAVVRALFVPYPAKQLP